MTFLVEGSVFHGIRQADPYLPDAGGFSNSLRRPANVTPELFIPSQSRRPVHRALRRRLLGFDTGGDHPVGVDVRLGRRICLIAGAPPSDGRTVQLFGGGDVVVHVLPFRATRMATSEDACAVHHLNTRCRRALENCLSPDCA